MNDDKSMSFEDAVEWAEIETARVSSVKSKGMPIFYIILATVIILILILVIYYMFTGQNKNIDTLELMGSDSYIDNTKRSVLKDPTDANYIDGSDLNQVDMTGLIGT